MFLSIPQKKNTILFKLIFGLAMSVVLLLASVGYSYRGSKGVYQTNTLIEHTDSIITQLQLLGIRLDNCEWSVRAYAASKDITFLYDYENSRKATRTYLESIENLTKGDSLQSQRVVQLQMLLEERFLFLDKAIAIEKGDMVDKKGFPSRRFKANQIRNKIVEVSKKLKEDFESTLNQRKQESKKLLNNAQTANGLAVILGCFIAGLLGIAVFKDVSEREKTEQQLRVLNDQKSQFFSIISHDLRGPTRNTTLLLEMMEDARYTTSKEDAQNMARLALESARQTQKLVEDLLTWGRLQMDQLAIVSTRFQPYEIVEKVCQSLYPAALLKGITVENKVPHNLLIQADSNMVETVIRNLVSNAIKFTPGSGSVKVVAGQFGQFVELTVEDSGIGMSEETIEKIFSFHTKHTTKGTAGEPGTGLGLAFCREFVERNGGNIHVDSQIGQGSRFNVRLPAAELIEQA